MLTQTLKQIYPINAPIIVAAIHIIELTIANIKIINDAIVTLTHRFSFNANIIMDNTSTVKKNWKMPTKTDRYFL